MVISCPDAMPATTRAPARRFRPGRRRSPAPGTLLNNPPLFSRVLVRAVGRPQHEERRWPRRTEAERLVQPDGTGIAVRRMQERGVAALGDQRGDGMDQPS